jgi:hypothetical protein
MIMIGVGTITNNRGGLAAFFFAGTVCPKK